MSRQPQRASAARVCTARVRACVHTNRGDTLAAHAPRRRRCVVCVQETPSLLTHHADAARAAPGCRAIGGVTRGGRRAAAVVP